MHSKFPCLITTGTHYPPLLSAHNYGQPFQRRVVDDLYGYEEGIEIEMGYDALGGIHGQIYEIPTVRELLLQRPEL